MKIPTFLYEALKSEIRDEFSDKYTDLNDFIEPKDIVSGEDEDFRFEFDNKYDNKYNDFELY